MLGRRTASRFSDPIRVNSVSGTAVAIGNIRGARVAVDRRGRAHVAWNGSRKMADPADQQGRVYVFWHAPIPGHRGEDSRRVWMARSDDDGKTFDRSVIFGSTRREPVAAVRLPRLQTRPGG